MAKKITAAFFIILANLVLLVHAVIPHHHHDFHLCFNDLSKEKTVNVNCCETNGSSHQHDSDNDDSSCFLKNIVALSSGEIKQNLKATIISHDLFRKVSFSILLIHKSGALTNPDFFLEIITQVPKSNYFSLACKASGLRAPPATC